ncbi:serine O-acetyltransferase [Candidatus Oscillochloris fontis]|uniref:serine O-acetyltransferase n=1 Tax=Candidatus Oscillochloris fontis TaxID=2496868 RepID=UPI00101CD076|nr:DapH/DapD/GlmU-related protein [Candidatus Oscillochloris fontis]
MERFKQDARRWIELGKINTDAPVTWGIILKLLFRYMPFRAIAWFRFGNWCQRKRIPYLPGFAQRQIFSRYGLDIVIGADIEGGLYIPHPIGMVVSPARIGKNCSLIGGITIGMRNTWEFPVIGDEVFVGTGARILGGITIGDRAQIGANAVVVSDVPAGATAVGIPARVTRING